MPVASAGDPDADGPRGKSSRLRVSPMFRAGGVGAARARAGLWGGARECARNGKSGNPPENSGGGSTGALPLVLLGVPPRDARGDGPRGGKAPPVGRPRHAPWTWARNRCRRRALHAEKHLRLACS